MVSDRKRLRDRKHIAIGNSVFQFRLSSLFLFTALVACILSLNLFPPQFMSFDPWLCRSDAGAFNVKNYGWPIHILTVFSEGLDGELGTHRLTNYSSLLINGLAAIAIVLAPLYILQLRRSH